MKCINEIKEERRERRHVNMQEKRNESREEKCLKGMAPIK